MIKMVFFDIDGTLTDPRVGRVSGRTRRAVEALRARGIRTIVATGRHPLELDDAPIEGMHFDGYVAANGQMCLDKDRTLLAGYPIGTQGMASLARLFERRQMTLWLFGEREAYPNMTDEDHPHLLKTLLGKRVQARPYRGEPIYQAVALVGPDMDSHLAKALPGCRLERWGRHGVDIISADGGKAEGMRFFMERHDIRATECMAFGDERNDIDMLAMAGTGVAMGGAVSSVREVADFVTAPAHEDGIVYALEHFALLEEGWDT